jgi:hypothetical protein
VRQGDLFQDVPLGYPWPPDAIDHDAGKRKFLSGPFKSGFAMLLTPTCSMIAQGVADSYAHPVRVLAPAIPLEELLDQEVPTVSPEDQSYCEVYATEARTPNQAAGKVRPLAAGRRLHAYLATGKYKHELADARWVA